MIHFAVQAPDKATFIQSWAAAGIMNEDGTLTFEYASDVQITDWDSGELPGKTGYFCNVRVSGQTEFEFTYGKPQTDENGQLLSIFERTWADMIFELLDAEADPETGFPAKRRSSELGIVYADMRDIQTPYNVWQ